MKFSEQWLREWVDPPVDTTRLAEQLTTAGLEVDGVESAAGEFDGVVVARVIRAEPHPDADRLRVCTVDCGAAEPVEVVCGAPNARAGLIAPFAPVGARIVGGKKIRASKIRGVKSNGMLCSPIELGLGEHGDGLLELSDDVLPGASLSETLGLDDVTIDLDLTPNRGDCLGLIGIAREVGVINRCAVKSAPATPVEATVQERFSVTLKAPEQCPRYVGRVIRDIDPTAMTPTWLKERLRRCGVRSISPVVDVTNFVMLELGQPMHAFDLDTLQGGIVVRKAQAGEKIVLLDGQTLSLDSEVLVIADEARAVALAGVMGGDSTGVTTATTNLFLESAYFEPRHVAVDARRFGLHTDASHRYERGVDPENQTRAVERATALLLDIVGGKPGPVDEQCVAQHLPSRAPVKLRRSRLERVLGVPVADDVVTDILGRLELNVSATEDGWQTRPPGFRFDIEIEADLIEEVARIVGYDTLVTQRPVADLGIQTRSESRIELRDLRAVLVNRGYREAITYSFVDSELQALVEPDVGAVELANPISTDMNVMRTSLWPGLIQAMLHNTNRQRATVRLFESGLTFNTTANGLEQTPYLAGLVTGPVFDRQWAEKDRSVDFFDLKADVETVLSVGRNTERYQYVTGAHRSLHPGQCASIETVEGTVGWLGMLHPRICQALKYTPNVFVFELNLNKVGEGSLPAFKVLSKFPIVTRDLSFVIDENISSQAVRDCVGQCSGDVLKKLELFDVYHGEGVDSGKKSVTLSLTFQASSHTLNDEEVESLRTNVMEVLGTELGASLRG